MVTIDTQKPVLTLKNEPYTSEGKNLTVGMVLAEVLSTNDSGGKMKMFALAKRAFESETMEVDESDFSVITKAVESSTAYGNNNLILGQTLAYIESIKK